MCTGQIAHLHCTALGWTHFVQVLRTSGIKLSCIKHISTAISSTEQVQRSLVSKVVGQTRDGGPLTSPTGLIVQGGERRVNSEIPFS